MSRTSISVTVGAGAGTGATASLDTYADDTRGNITVTTGSTGAAAGLLCTLNCSGSWAGYPSTVYPQVQVIDSNASKVSNLGFVFAQMANTNTQMQVYCTGTPAASTAYVINYFMVP